MKTLILFAVCIGTLAAVECPCEAGNVSLTDFCNSDFVSHVEVKSHKQLDTISGVYWEYNLEHKHIYRPKSKGWLPDVILAPFSHAPCPVQLQKGEEYLLGGVLDRHYRAFVNSCGIVITWSNVTQAQKELLETYDCDPVGLDVIRS